LTFYKFFKSYFFLKFLTLTLSVGDHQKINRLYNCTKPILHSVTFGFDEKSHQGFMPIETSKTQFYQVRLVRPILAILKQSFRFLTKFRLLPKNLKFGKKRNFCLSKFKY